MIHFLVSVINLLFDIISRDAIFEMSKIHNAFFLINELHLTAALLKRFSLIFDGKIELNASLRISDENVIFSINSSIMTCVNFELDIVPYKVLKILKNSERPLDSYVGIT